MERYEVCYMALIVECKADDRMSGFLDTLDVSAPSMALRTTPKSAISRTYASQHCTPHAREPCLSRVCANFSCHYWWLLLGRPALPGRLHAVIGMFLTCSHVCAICPGYCIPAYMWDVEIEWCKTSSGVEVLEGLLTDLQGEEIDVRGHRCGQTL